MADLHPGPVPQPLDSNAPVYTQDNYKGLPFQSSSNDTPFHSQLSSIPQGQFRSDNRSSTHPASTQYLAPDGASSLSMGSMVATLPEYATVESGHSDVQAHQHGQRPLSGASTSALVYQLQQNLQMPNHASGALPNHSPYAPTYGHAQYPQGFVPSQHSPTNYAAFQPSQQRVAGPNSMQSSYQAYPQHSQYMYYSAPYGTQAQYSPGYPPQAAQVQAFYGRRTSNVNASMPMNGHGMDYAQHDGGFAPGNRHMAGAVQEPGTMGHILTGTFDASGVNRPGPVSSVPRGPPRKPKQSGHALWVGNLPPGTTVVALKDHFSRDATKDIESLFLISKSNCAFVNYRTEASCTAAMHRFHDSRFNGVRLVCRLRRSSAPASGVPTGPSAMLGNQPSASPPRSPHVVDGEDTQVDGESTPNRTTSEESRLAAAASERYFIVKSLTLQDLESSVRNGIWATQSHNEDVLNKAYQSAENVYLIFSANKSGEYFGYARMASPILESAEKLIDSAPKAEVHDAPDVPKSIPTPATEFAPRGRIIDDSARGTIFWEAELSDSEAEQIDREKEDHPVDHEVTGTAQSWGKPFKIEWISTNRLPFYRTRGLRNSWNANREVKIARDGTELETSVGERLIQMFHRLGPSSTVAPMSAMNAPMVMPPHPQMRLY